MKSLKPIARLTGLGYLLIFITGFFANFYILENMIVENDAHATTFKILSQMDQYQLGLAAFSIMVIVDIILAIPLYKLLKDTSSHISLASSVLRLINGTFFALALFNLFEITTISQGAPDTLELHVLNLLSEFNALWNLGLLFFGAHLLLLGCLVFRSVHFPKLVGALLQLAGFTYLLDSGAQLFISNYEDYKSTLEILVIGGGVIGELSLTIWLLLKGVKDIKAAQQA